MAALLQKSFTSGSVKAAKPARRATAVVCRAERVEEVALNRRAALGTLAGAAALLASTSPSQAAFGDSANIFGKVTNKSNFIPFVSDNFTVLLPSKWNPSQEQDFASPGSKRAVELRYEDNFFPVNNVIVLSQPTDKKSIEDYGDQQKFLQENIYLLGTQAYDGKTISEGGFAPNRVSAASVLDLKTETDKKGKKIYKYDVLTRAADGNEGGRRNLIAACVGGGKLYIVKVQAGDKRWVKGTDKEAFGIINSFTLAV